jgi:hypothetical protein
MRYLLLLVAACALALLWRLAPPDRVLYLFEREDDSSIPASTCSKGDGARTPAPALHACLPKDLGFTRSVWSSLAGDRLSYCLETNDTPYCFEADLTTRTVVPAPVPPAVLAPRAEHTDEVASYPTATRDEASGGVKVCTGPDTCRVLPARTEPDPRLAISDDGTLIAVGNGRNVIETWDVSAGKRIARFHARFGAPGRDRGDSGMRTLSFFGHDVLAAFNPCAGPCGTATMYSARGKDLGPFPVEASESGDLRFHDDIWIATHEMGFAIVDTSTGAVLQHVRTDEPGLVASVDHAIAVLGGDQVGKVLVYDRTGRLAAELETPRCR